MKKRYVFFLSATVLAGALSGLGWLNERIAFNAWRLAEAQCREAQPFEDKLGSQLPKGSHLVPKDEAIIRTYQSPEMIKEANKEQCDGEWLHDDPIIFNDVQTRVVSSYKDYENTESRLEFLTFISPYIFVIGLVPLVWYFLLERLAEVVATIKKR